MVNLHDIKFYLTFWHEVNDWLWVCETWQKVYITDIDEGYHSSKEISQTEWFIWTIVFHGCDMSESSAKKTPNDAWTLI